MNIALCWTTAFAQASYLPDCKSSQARGSCSSWPASLICDQAGQSCLSIYQLTLCKQDDQPCVQTASECQVVAKPWMLNMPFYSDRFSIQTSRVTTNKVKIEKGQVVKVVSNFCIASHLVNSIATHFLLTFADVSRRWWPWCKCAVAIGCDVFSLVKHSYLWLGQTGGLSGH